MRISLEIVPRSPDSLTAAYTAADAFPAITAVNFPDLLRFPLRSWEACAVLAAASEASAVSGKSAVVAPSACRRELIPHLRAIDFDLDAPFPHAEAMLKAGVRTVLAIAGDPPQDMRHRVYPTGTTDFIRKLKAELPGVKVLAAFDPYRTNIRFELDYVRAKEEAGADGFLSQPFFDLRLLEIYAEYLEGKTVFWGISPVVSVSSRDYWTARNRAIFPRAFAPTLDWNVNFGRRVLTYCRANDFNLYLMPIKVDTAAYLNGLFAADPPPRSN